jgi:hypothetical protein
MGNTEQAEAEVYYRHVRNAKILRKLALYAAIAAAVFGLAFNLSGEVVAGWWAGGAIMAGALLGGAAFAQWASRHGQSEPDPYSHP